VEGFGLEGIHRTRLGPAVERWDRMIASGEAGTFDFAVIDADTAISQTTTNVHGGGCWCARAA